MTHPFASRRGRKVRDAQLGREPFCLHCYERGILTEAVEVDHVVPIAEGGAHVDRSNLQSLCRDCHIGKHGGRPRLRIDPETGLPLPGQRHWWSESR